MPGRGPRMSGPGPRMSGPGPYISGPGPRMSGGGPPSWGWARDVTAFMLIIIATKKNPMIIFPNMALQFHVFDFFILATSNSNQSR
jgi:hypothetical protein